MYLFMLVVPSEVVHTWHVNEILFDRGGNRTRDLWSWYSNDLPTELRDQVGSNR